MRVFDISLHLPFPQWNLLLEVWVHGSCFGRTIIPMIFFILLLIFLNIQKKMFLSSFWFAPRKEMDFLLWIKKEKIHYQFFYWYDIAKEALVPFSNGHLRSQGAVCWNSIFSRNKPLCWVECKKLWWMQVFLLEMCYLKSHHFPFGTIYAD